MGKATMVLSAWPVESSPTIPCLKPQVLAGETTEETTSGQGWGRGQGLQKNKPLPGHMVGGNAQCIVLGCWGFTGLLGGAAPAPAPGEMAADRGGTISYPDPSWTLDTGSLVLGRLRQPGLETHPSSL